MDARDVLREWIGDPDDPFAPPPPDRRGKRGSLLQGSSPQLYRTDTEDWLTFIEDVVRIGAWRAEPSHIKTWLDARGGPDGSLRSRARRVSALGAFYVYAVEKGYATVNPVDPRLGTGAWNAPRLPKLTAGQMHLLRWGTDQLVGPLASRDRLLMYLMLAGLRSRQITEINVQQLHFEQSRLVIEVWQKGGGTRPVAFPEEVREVVRAYRPDRPWRPPHSYDASGPLLVTHGVGKNGVRLNPRDMPRQILRQVAAVAVRHPDEDAPELPLKLTPDIVAHSPSPFALTEEVRPRRRQQPREA